MQRWKEAMSAPGPVTTPLGTRTGRKGVLGEPPAKLMRTCHSGSFFMMSMILVVAESKKKVKY